jgi:hypothetical protein
MTNARARLSVALIVAAVPILLASCSKKEEPAPAAQATPTPAPATTMPPATPTPVPTPPPVWREARWGMSPADLLAAFGGEAQRLERPVDFTKPQDGSSLAAGSSDVTIPTYEADGATFRVLFGFDSDRLSRIHLAGVKPGAGTCGDVEKALTDKHGAPAGRQETGTSLKGEEVLWKRPDQTIVLSCAGMASLGFVTVTVDYLTPS